MNNFARFRSSLFRWYQKNARRLPWRTTNDPYRIWISEIMLQQTTVAAVIPYYERWMTVFPTIRHVARTSQQRILKVWQGLGYYSRARNIHRSAQIICREYNGQIPNDAELLAKLPGFGPYTMAAVLSIAFGQTYPVVDANVRRVCMRLLAMEGEAHPRHDRSIREYLEKIIDSKDPGTFNQAFMELGALVCRAREPLCTICPVKSFCQAYAKGIQEIIPLPKKTQLKKVAAAIAVIRDGDVYFLQKRPSKGLFADLWEFPGGKIEQGESPRAAVFREVDEELGIRLTSAQPLTKLKHFYTQFSVTLHVFLCEISHRPTIQSNRKWLKRNDLEKYPMPSGSARIVDFLLAEASRKNTLDK